MEGEKQETLETEEKRKSETEVLNDKFKVLEASNDLLKHNLKIAKDRVSMLEVGIASATTTTQLLRKEDQDSIEIGAQATGRMKVHGDFGKKQEFAAKIKDAFEILTASQEQLRKVPLNGSDKKGGSQ